MPGRVHLRGALMVSRNSSPRSKKSVSLSVMLGTLLVPSAFAASSLVETSGVAESVTAWRHRWWNQPPTRPRPLGPTWRQLVARLGSRWSLPRRTEPSASCNRPPWTPCAGSALSRGCRFRHLRRPNRWPHRHVSAPAPTGEQVVVASEDDDRHGRHGGDDDDEDDHGRHGGDDDDDDDHDRHGEDHD